MNFEYNKYNELISNLSYIENNLIQNYNLINNHKKMVIKEMENKNPFKDELKELKIKKIKVNLKS